MNEGQTKLSTERRAGLASGGWLTGSAVFPVKWNTHGDVQAV